jgi:hypothetical protein
MTALSPAEADALAAREQRRMAATATVNSATFTVAAPGGYSPGAVHGGALSGWRRSGPDLQARLRVDAVGWRGGSGPAVDLVEVLVPRGGSDPADAWQAAETLARLNAGGA